MSDDTNKSNVASLAEITIGRDSDGQIVDKLVPNALTIFVDGKQVSRDVRIIPTTYGDAVSKFGDTGKVSSVGSDVVADMINDHLLEPDFREHPRCPDDRVTAEFVENELPPLVPAHIVKAILEGSGVPVDSVQSDGAGGANVELGGN